MNLSKELDKRRDAAVQITGWCVVISLNQDFGVGHIRLNRMFAQAEGISSIYRSLKLSSGRERADTYLDGLLRGKCSCMDFRVPVLKAPRSARDRQIRMAENDSATTTWRIYAASCVNALGYAEDRLQRLHDSTWSNYEQFVTEWYDVGEEVAVEHIRRCAEQAIRENLRVKDDDDEEPVTLYSGLTSEEKTAFRIRLSSAIAKTSKSGFPLAVPCPASIDVTEFNITDWRSARRFPKK